MLIINILYSKSEIFDIFGILKSEIFGILGKIKSEIFGIFIEKHFAIFGKINLFLCRST